MNNWSVQRKIEAALVVAVVLACMAGGLGAWLGGCSEADKFVYVTTAGVFGGFIEYLATR